MIDKGRAYTMSPTSKFFLSGVVPILPTPFHVNGSIDFDSYQLLVDFAASAGTGGVGLPAYGSEFYKLSDKERGDVVSAAVEASARRIPVVAQCNHYHPDEVIRMAKTAQRHGADVIAFELPRRFPYCEAMLLEYAKTITASVGLPVLIQDWNPGGSTVGVDFISRLHAACENFVAIKLEEPAMGPKLEAIRNEVGDSVAVFEGWGGIYVVELGQSGIAGIMPGIALADVMVDVFNACRSDPAEAHRLFAPFMPFVQYSLQNMEHFHHVEKPLARMRGLISTDHVRPLTVELDPCAAAYRDLLIEETIQCLERAGYPLEAGVAA